MFTSPILNNVSRAARVFIAAAADIRISTYFPQNIPIPMIRVGVREAQVDSEFRELSTREKELLQKLLDAAIEGRDELRTQLNYVKAKQIEDDGTLLLECSGGTGAPGKYAPVAEGVCKDADAGDIAVILHLGKGGFMSMLEIVKYGGQPIINPPSAQNLALFMPESPGQKPTQGARRPE
jgi:hypothetical protein